MGWHGTQGFATPLMTSPPPTCNYRGPNYDLYWQRGPDRPMEMDGEGQGQSRLIIDWKDSDGLGVKARPVRGWSVWVEMWPGFKECSFG